MRRLLCGLLLCVWGGAGLLLAAEPVGRAQDAALATLKGLAQRQRELLQEAERKTSQAEAEDMRPEFQTLVLDYEEFVRAHPDLTAGYISYAQLLNQPLLGERKRATALLLKANQLNPDLPVVKNQLGNYLAEEGRPLDAIQYYLAAVKLAPDEPLYHFQLGSLLAEARDDFLKSGLWTRAQLEGAMHEGFEQAMVLSPGDVTYALAYCKSFYELEAPDWDEALRNWRALEGKMTTPQARELTRLHQAKVLIEQKRGEEARAVLATVTAEEFQEQAQKLVAQLPSDEAK